MTTNYSGAERLVDPPCGNRRNHLIPDEVRDQPGGARLKVYIALADRCNDSGTCYPSLTTIAKDAKVSRSSVCEALRWLETSGHVQRQKRRPNGDWTSTLYLLPAQVRHKTPAQLLVQPTALLVQPTAPGSPAERTTGSPAHRTQTLTKRTLPKEHTPSASSKKPMKKLALPVPATPTPWEVAHAAILDAFPDAFDKRQRGFAGEIAKVAKGSGCDPARLVRLAALLISLQGIPGLDALSVRARSALLSRLSEVLALNPTPSALKERWGVLSARRGWPSDIGQRLERLIAQWHTLDPGTTPLGNAPAGSRMTSRLQNLVTAPTQDVHRTAKELTA